MTAKYTLYALVQYGSVDHLMEEKPMISSMILVCWNSLGPMCHWIYASQYMKTCVLIPGLVNRAQLLLARHITVIENEYEVTTLLSDFVRKHKEIDHDIKKEKMRGKRVNKTFFMIDGIVAVMLLSLFSSLFYDEWEEAQHKHHDTEEKIFNILQFLPPIFDVTISLLLVFAANYLTKLLRRSTGKE